MTRQESFKRRIRARMEITGEKYGAARRVLIEQATRSDWVSEPDMSNARIVEATGRDATPGTPPSPPTWWNITGSTAGGHRR